MSNFATSWRDRLRFIQHLHEPRLKELGVQYAEDVDTDRWIFRTRDGKTSYVCNSDLINATDPTEIITAALHEIGVEA